EDAPFELRALRVIRRERHDAIADQRIDERGIGATQAVQVRRRLRADDGAHAHALAHQQRVGPRSGRVAYFLDAPAELRFGPEARLARQAAEHVDEAAHEIV